ncbi:MAG: hypothetical protein Ct9H300mP29_8090 [Candidatus Neomarinimicrobiota bacterium]|nr:MAG: hypothetical protein Ct9H300mP29_8090 [Candidatus Neomarinimicrobiota bacterium]
MLYDEINVKDVVDSESALEFMKEATKLASSSELENIGQKLEKKKPSVLLNFESKRH